MCRNFLAIKIQKQRRRNFKPITALEADASAKNVIQKF